MNRTSRSLLLAVTVAGAAVLDPVVDTTVVLPNGLFELAGYGTILHVEGEDVTPFYVTASTCVAGEAFDNELPVDHAGGDGAITLDLVGPTTDYQLRPLQGDLQCDSAKADTIKAVDVLFNTHYPFFAERGVDWDNELAELQASTDDEPCQKRHQALIEAGPVHRRA